MIKLRVPPPPPNGGQSENITSRRTTYAGGKYIKICKECLKSFQESMLC